MCNKSWLFLLSLALSKLANLTRKSRFGLLVAPVCCFVSASAQVAQLLLDIAELARSLPEPTLLSLPLPSKQVNIVCARVFKSLGETIAARLFRVCPLKDLRWMRRQFVDGSENERQVCFNGATNLTQRDEKERERESTTTDTT